MQTIDVSKFGLSSVNQLKPAKLNLPYKCVYQTDILIKLSVVLWPAFISIQCHLCLSVSFMQYNIIYMAKDAASCDKESSTLE